jgi:hypothetical protein
MDIIKKNKLLFGVIIILVLLNLTTIFMLWYGKPKPFIDRPDMPDHKNGRLENLLKVELGFSEDQIEKFILLRDEHRKNIFKLNEEIRSIKKTLFDKIILDGYQKEISDSLINLSLEKQKEIEEHTIRHFIELENLCEKDQKSKLMNIMHKLLGPPPPNGTKGSPHLPSGDRPPSQRN